MQGRWSPLSEAEESEREEIMARKLRDLAIRFNLEQAEMTLKALDDLSDVEKRKVTYQKLHKDLELVKSIWVKRAKNEALIKKSRSKQAR